jgi:protoporphyrinogen oxidase
MNHKKAIIIGAGPAGLTAAYELMVRSDIKPVILEQSSYMGGLSRTVNYKGNRIDIGGHRFFSKSDRVMNWWLARMPLERNARSGSSINLTCQQKSKQLDVEQIGPDPEKENLVMLLRHRKSRIYFAKKMFNYPISLTLDTVKKLGLKRIIRIWLSFLKATILPIKPVKNLEDFYINSFGKELYKLFFKDYTHKVWGIDCSQLSSEWGAQRTKGLSLSSVITHFFKRLISPSKDIRQKTTQTSLIEQFLYPKFGPGQMWETVSHDLLKYGAKIHTHHCVDKINVLNNRVISVEAINTLNGERLTFDGDYFFSTMPIKDLVKHMNCSVPSRIAEIASGLIYRDFITIGLLVSKLNISDATNDGQKLISDNWIYIQEPSVKLGRLQIFNNWSPFMVSDPTKIWLGLEYFCNEGDELWSLADKELMELAIGELSAIGIIENSAVNDATVIRMAKTYPAYSGTYDRFPELQDFLDSIPNLFLIGRNGMHKYNNQDHSMLTAMVAVDNILSGRADKKNIWQINTEMEYHEIKKFTEKSLPSCR